MQTNIVPRSCSNNTVVRLQTETPHSEFNFFGLRNCPLPIQESTDGHGTAVIPSLNPFCDYATREKTYGERDTFFLSNTTGDTLVKLDALCKDCLMPGFTSSSTILKIMMQSLATRSSRDTHTSSLKKAMITKYSIHCTLPPKQRDTHDFVIVHFGWLTGQSELPIIAIAQRHIKHGTKPLVHYLDQDLYSGRGYNAPTRWLCGPERLYIGGTLIPLLKQALNGTPFAQALPDKKEETSMPGSLSLTDTAKENMYLQIYRDYHDLLAGQRQLLTFIKLFLNNTHYQNRIVEFAHSYKMNLKSEIISSSSSSPSGEVVSRSLLSTILQQQQHHMTAHHVSGSI